MMSWWNCVAKEEKRQERPVTRPPVTAVRRVDLWRQRETEAGASTSDTAVHSGDSQPGTRGSVSAADDSSVFTLGFHKHGEGPYYNLLLVESTY